MADLLSLPAIASLDPDAVAAAQAELTQRLQEQFPELDLRRGVLHDRDLYLGAVIVTLLRTQQTLLQQSQSLLLIGQNPALADDALVDQVLANFQITRGAGAAASGTVTIVLDGLVPVVIPAALAFSAGGVVFQPDAAYAARISAETVTSSTDRVLRALTDGSGNFAFTITLVAQTPGAAGMLKRGQLLDLGTAIPHVVSAYVESDFTGGFDPPSNAALLEQLQDGLAIQAFSNRGTLGALLRSQPAFAGVLQSSVIGAGDPEMVRDQHSILPISIPGRCDLYARTAPLPQAVALTKTATLISIPGSGGGIWQLAIGRDDLPGFYEIEAVQLSGATATSPDCPVQTDIRGIDTSNLDFVPDLANPQEAAYSRYQTAVVRFLDTQTPTAGLVINQATQDYLVTLSGLPLLDQVQDFLAGRSVRPPAGDLLVKAPIPCYLGVTLTVAQPAGAMAPDTGAIAQALADYVNGLGFAGQVYATALAQVALGLLPGGSAVRQVDLLARIRRGDGSNQFLHATTVLTIPDLPALQLSGRTACFYLDPQDVVLAVSVLDSPVI